MDKNRKTSHILNIFQYDVDGHVVLPASLTLSIAPGASDNNSKVPTTAWVRTYVSGLTYATQSYVNTQVANLVASSPATLDTLNELAAALGNDPNFATSVATSIGTKQAQLNGTGFVKVTGTTVSYDNSTYLTTSSAASTYQTILTNPITGTGTTQTLAKFTSTGSTIGNSNIVLSSGANFVEMTVGSTSGSVNNYNTLSLLAVTEPRIYLTASDGFNSVLFNSYGNIGFQAQFSNPSVNNFIFYYNGYSSTNKSLVFQTSGLDRLTLNQNGSVRLNNYTTNGFVKFSGSDGTLIVDTNTYLTTSSASSTYQTILTNPVTGTGTSGYIPKFTGASTIGSSLIYDTNSVVLIGATTGSGDTQTKLELINNGPVGLKIKSSAVNGNNTFLSLESSKEWRFVTNRGDLIGGNQGDLIIRNNTDGINHIILNQSGTTIFSGAISASNLSGTNTGDQTLSGLGGVPTSRTITINGTALDLSANRSWSVGTVVGNNNILSDANGANVTINGGYFTGFNPSNIPSGQSSGDWGVMNFPIWTGNSSGERYAVQLAANIDDNAQIFIRKFKFLNTVSLQTWYALLHSGNFSSYALPLSGGIMTGDIQMGNNQNRIIKFRTASAWDYSLRGVNDDFFITDNPGLNYIGCYYNGGGGNRYISLMGMFNIYPNGVVNSGNTINISGQLNASGRIHAATYGNASRGSILMGVENNTEAKWSYLLSTQYNSSTNPTGYALIGGYTSATENRVIIGGSIYEANPATSIEFWTHTAVTHATGGSLKMTITSAGTLQPAGNGTQDLGTSSLRWSTVFTSDLSLSNGIGDYTIVEGENDLFLYNNKQNKVYKFMLAEVDPADATPKKS